MGKIKIKKLTATAKIPTRGSEKAAGFDLYADIEAPITIHPHETEKISSGVAVQPPEGYFGLLMARSGLATKKNLVLRTGCSAMDEDYRGPYIVPLYNDSDYPKTVNPDERIAQVVFIPYFTGDEQVVAELDDSDRGKGGFGSTGTN